MSISSKLVQQRYKGFCNTPLLWKNGNVLGLRPFELDRYKDSIFLRELHKKHRLGHWAEQFAFNQIEHEGCAEILAENLQIQRDKHTLGELDALILLNYKPIHLEIVYKFYVYDKTLGDSEISRWVGPNRKDSLNEKIQKLKARQLPLLYSAHGQNTLKTIQLEQFKFEQQVLFKAQLFEPYNELVPFDQLNRSCIQGFYINKEQLELFKNSQFYIPKKLDWFIIPHLNVEWMNYNTVHHQILAPLKMQQSPLIWIKQNDTLHKVFVLWW